MAARSYNFRFATQRDAFYEQVRIDRKAIEKELGDEIASELRLVFEIGTFGKKERLKQEKRVREKDENAFRGLRTFKGLTRLRKFLSSSKDGGSGVSWGRKNLAGTEMQARLCYYEQRGSRVVGEKVLRRYKITTT